MEAEVTAAYPDSDIKLIGGRGGVFNVKYNGKLLYSKQDIKEQRFPKKGEIIRLIEQEKQ